MAAALLPEPWRRQVSESLNSWNTWLNILMQFFILRLLCGAIANRLQFWKSVKSQHLLKEWELLAKILNWIRRLSEAVVGVSKLEESNFYVVP